MVLKNRISPKSLDALVEIGGKKKWLPLREAMRKVGMGGARWAMPMLAMALGLGALADLFAPDDQKR